MTRSPGIFVVVLAIAAAHMACATAQSARHSTPPSPKQLDEARAHFKAAEAGKAHGEYQAAAVEYLAAYRLFEHPEFFFDTAEVYRLAGDEQNALTYYEKYLELDPCGRGAAIARSRAGQLHRPIALKQDAACGCRDEGGGRKADDGTGRKACDDDGHRLRVAGIATGALGVVALGAGAGFGVKAHRVSNELSMAGAFDRRRYDEGRVAEHNFALYSGVGAAGVVAGGVLYYLGARARHATATEALTLVPVVAPSSLTVSLSGRF